MGLKLIIINAINISHLWGLIVFYKKDLRLLSPLQGGKCFFHFYATNLLPLRGIEVLIFFLEIGYWLFLIE